MIVILDGFMVQILPPFCFELTFLAVFEFWGSGSSLFSVLLADFLVLVSYLSERSC